MVVSKGELKAKMLAYFRKVEETGEELIVTDNRVPVLKVIPIKTKASHSWEEIFPKSHKIQYSSTEDLIESEPGEWGENSL
jgi:antitoxin (DNA-binding transcriptional repressor) of toxin-antitoxin stability system